MMLPARPIQLSFLLSFLFLLPHSTPREALLHHATEFVLSHNFTPSDALLQLASFQLSPSLCFFGKVS